MKSNMKTILLGLILASIVGLAVSARATEYYGATQGFWKNHPELWSDSSLAYNTGTLVMDVFDADHLVWYMKTYEWTLLDVLNIPFGYCSQHILIRQAVAALLNAQQFGNGYPLTTQQLIDTVNAALNSGGLYGLREVKITLSEELDGYNNAGLPEGWP